MSKRYGSPGEVAGFAGAFGALVILAAVILFASADLMSNNCIVGTSQDMCPIDGPDWARPVPAAVIVLGLVTALIGVAAGRPVRTPALITGYGVVALGLIISLAIG